MISTGDWRQPEAGGRLARVATTRTGRPLHMLRGTTARRQHYRSREDPRRSIPTDCMTVVDVRQLKMVQLYKESERWQH